MSKDETLEENEGGDAPRGAILQRDRRTWAIVPRTPLGIVTADQLETIARVVKKHGIPVVKITSGQRLALVGLEAAQVEAVWADLGAEVGPASELCVHYVQACPGTTLCRYGKRDSLGLGTRLEKLLVGVDTPAKVKLGVSGCPLNCGEAFTRDVGLLGRKSGWTLIFGGNAGAKPRLGDVVAKDLDDDAAVAAVERLLELYRAGGKRKERTSRYVERVGLDAVVEAFGVAPRT